MPPKQIFQLIQLYLQHHEANKHSLLQLISPLSDATLRLAQRFAARSWQELVPCWRPTEQNAAVYVALVQKESALRKPSWPQLESREAWCCQTMQEHIDVLRDCSFGPSSRKHLQTVKPAQAFLRCPWKIIRLIGMDVVLLRVRCT